MSRVTFVLVAIALSATLMASQSFAGASCCDPAAKGGVNPAGFSLAPQILRGVPVAPAAAPAPVPQRSVARARAGSAQVPVAPAGFRPITVAEGVAPAASCCGGQPRAGYGCQGGQRAGVPGGCGGCGMKNRPSCCQPAPQASCCPPTSSADPSAGRRTGFVGPTRQGSVVPSPVLTTAVATPQLNPQYAPRSVVYSYSYEGPAGLW